MRSLRKPVAIRSITQYSFATLNPCKSRGWCVVAKLFVCARQAAFRNRLSDNAPPRPLTCVLPKATVESRCPLPAATHLSPWFWSAQLLISLARRDPSFNAPQTGLTTMIKGSEVETPEVEWFTVNTFCPARLR